MRSRPAQQLSRPAAKWLVPKGCISRVLSFLLFVAGAGRISGQGFPPGEALKRMRVADGLEVKLFARSEEHTSEL